MRVAIDARELAGQPTGVGRYLGEILREWGSMPEAAQHEFILCAPTAVDVPGPLRAETAVAPGGGTLWEQRALPRLAARRGADVVFCPAYSGPIFDGPPLVLSIHDVSFAAHPEWFRWREGLRRRFVTRASARRAARVLALTEFSKREIVDHLGVPAGRIEVVYPGVTAMALERASPRAEPLVLYVGSIFNRRHVPETIRGFERLAGRRPEVRLTIVGDNRTFPRIDLERLVHNREHVDLRSYVPDQALADLYGRAGAFVFLSEYEGFGLTPLDALAARIPIVVLDTAVAREAYGDAALYLTEPRPRLIESALEAALFDESARAAVLSAAAGVLRRYSWAECARRVLDALVLAAR